MAADVSGGGVHDDGGAMVERPAQDRRGRIVDDQGDAELPPDIRDFPDRENRQLGVRQRLGVVGPSSWVRRAAEVLRVDRIDEPDLDTHGRQRVLEQVPGAAIEVCGADDVVAGMRDVLDGERRSRLTRAYRERRRAAFQGRHAFLENRAGRVHGSGIDVA